jgi:hypothetical protein
LAASVVHPADYAAEPHMYLMTTRL